MRTVIILVSVIFLLVALLTVELVDQAVDHEGAASTEQVRAWGRTAAPYVVDEEMFTTTTTARARTAPTLRAASASKPVVVTETSVNGYPCGQVNDLPPCWVMRRESNGNPTAQNPHSTASGLWQVLDSTWRNFRGFAKARLAPAEIQTEFARLLWNHGAGCAHWSACR